MNERKELMAQDEQLVFYNSPCISLFIKINICPSLSQEQLWKCFIKPSYSQINFYGCYSTALLFIKTKVAFAEN
jgi:dynactin complex subunit